MFTLQKRLKKTEKGTKKAPKRHQKATKKTPKRHQRGTKEALKRHQRDTKEAPKRHQKRPKRGPKETKKHRQLQVTLLNRVGLPQIEYLGVTLRLQWKNGTTYFLDENSSSSVTLKSATDFWIVGGIIPWAAHGNLFSSSVRALPRPTAAARQPAASFRALLMHGGAKMAKERHLLDYLDLP